MSQCVYWLDWFIHLLITCFIRVLEFVTFPAATHSTGDESSATGNTDIIVPVLPAAMVVAVIIAITVVIVALRWRKHKKVAIKILR